MVKKVIYKLVGISLVAAIVLSACSAVATTAGPAILPASPTSPNQGVSSPESPTNTPAATATPAPVATATPAPVASPTLPAIPTAAATTAPSSSTAQVVPTTNPYCRKGPGFGYDSITFLLSGNAYNVIGRDSLNSWWQVQAPGNVNCWVPDANVTRQGPVEQVSIVQAPPLPGMSGQFVNSYVCNVSKKTLTVALDWAAEDNVTGYTIYRDGNQIAQVGSTVTSYSDSAPLGSDLLYELQPFNDYGVAPRISNSVPACR